MSTLQENLEISPEEWASASSDQRERLVSKYAKLKGMQLAAVSRMLIRDDDELRRRGRLILNDLTGREDEQMDAEAGHIFIADNVTMGDEAVKNLGGVAKAATDDTPKTTTALVGNPVTEPRAAEPAANNSWVPAAVIGMVLGTFGAGGLALMLNTMQSPPVDTDTRNTIRFVEEPIAKAEDPRLE